MKWIAIILGILMGKRSVRCTDCQNLDEDNKCFGHQMSDEAIQAPLTCGFFKSKS